MSEQPKTEETIKRVIEGAPGARVASPEQLAQFFDRNASLSRERIELAVRCLASGMDRQDDMIRRLCQQQAEAQRTLRRTLYGTWALCALIVVGWLL